MIIIPISAASIPAKTLNIIIYNELIKMVSIQIQAIYFEADQPLVYLWYSTEEVFSCGKFTHLDLDAESILLLKDNRNFIYHGNRVRLNDNKTVPNYGSGKWNNILNIDDSFVLPLSDPLILRVIAKNDEMYKVADKYGMVYNLTLFKDSKVLMSDIIPETRQIINDWFDDEESEVSCDEDDWKKVIDEVEDLTDYSVKVVKQEKVKDDWTTVNIN